MRNNSAHENAPAAYSPTGADNSATTILRDWEPLDNGPAIGTPDTLLQYALSYADLGLRVIPCHAVDDFCSCSCGDLGCKNAGKHPRILDWPKRASTEAWQVHHWWGHDADERQYRHPDYLYGGRFSGANVGIATGRGLAVIDVDPRHGGLETLAALEAELGPLDRSWTVRTGGGGLHIYFTVPRKLPFRLRDLGPGVEIKHTGRFVIAPPSVHKSGPRYEWVSCIGEKPPLMSKSWLNRAKDDHHIDANHSDTNDLHNTPRTDSDESSNNREHEHPVHLAHGDPGIPGNWSHETGRRLKYAAIRCKVEHHGDCNVALMNLAGSILRIPGMAGRPPGDFLPTLGYWHAASRNTNEEWPAIQKHWPRAWKSAKRRRDDSRDTALMAHRAIMAAPVPPDIAARYAGDDAMQRLTVLCAEICRRANGVGYLSRRKAGDLLGIHHLRAGRMLRQLEADGVIAIVGERKRGSPKAPRFRYVGECSWSHEHYSSRARQTA